MTEYDIFQKIIMEIRQWDRFEHNWQIGQRKELKEVKNLTTKETLIKELMLKYEIKLK